MRYECKCAACLGAPCYTRRTTSFVVCQDFWNYCTNLLFAGKQRFSWGKSERNNLYN
jgi:hypothetical protein